MRYKPGGISQVITPYKVEESYSSTCAHCQHITDFSSMRKMHDYVDVCRSCMKLICLHCSGKPCTPWLKQCEIEEKLDQQRRLREWT